MRQRVKRSHNEMVPMSRFFAASSVLRASALGLAGLLSACVSVERQSGPLPEWARDRAAEVQGKGYPSLANVPDKPVGLPDLAEWIVRRDQLEALNARMAASPCAIVPKTDAEAWARATGGPVAADPRGTVPAGEDPAIWARRQLAQLPPAPPKPMPMPARRVSPAAQQSAPPPLSSAFSAPQSAVAPSPDTSNDPRILQNQTPPSVCL